MAKLADVQASLDALDAKVTEVAADIAALKGAQGAATEADLDAVKGRVDAAVAALQAAK